MDSPQPDVRLQESLARYGRAAVTVALAVAALDWVGWTCGIEPLTRINRAWPQMMPWTALWLAALAAAIAAQSGRPSRARVWAGRGLAVAVGILAAVVLAEYATGRSFGLDEVWFTETVRALHWSWPGRPSSPTALAVLPVAAAVALMRLDRGTSGAWAVCVAAGGTIAFVSVAAYLFDAVSLVGVTPSRGQSISTALTLLLLVTASAAARPDRFPFAWLLARPDRRSLVRLLGILAGFPVVVALSRATFLAVGVGEPTEWSLSIVVGTLIAGAVTFYLSQREQRLLIEKELVSKKRADAEARYRILADNAVDVIVHLRGSEVAWISPSVEAALGGPPQQWIGADPSRRIHADDVDAVVAALGGYRRRRLGAAAVPGPLRRRRRLPLGRQSRQALRRRRGQHRRGDRGASSPRCTRHRPWAHTWASCSATSTASRTSTTRGATASATPCSPLWRPGSATASAKATPSAGREATRSSSCCPTSRATTRSPGSPRRFACVPPNRFANPVARSSRP